MTSQELVSASLELHDIARRVSTLAREALGPHEGTDATRAINALTLEVERRAGTRLLTEAQAQARLP